MTRTQAWRKVAEAFDTPLERRSAYRRWLTQCGLCWAVSQLDNRWGPYRPAIYDEMAELGDQFGLEPHWWPKRNNDPEWTPECDTERATFAGLMAAMTQRERDQLVKGL